MPTMPDLRSIIHSDPDIHSGDPVFVGTRVPVRTLLDYLEGGDSLDVFLDNFPSVSREQAVAFLEEATRTALAQIALSGVLVVRPFRHGRVGPMQRIVHMFSS